MKVAQEVERTCRRDNAQYTVGLTFRLRKTGWRFVECKQTFPKDGKAVGIWPMFLRQERPTDEEIQSAMSWLHLANSCDEKHRMMIDDHLSLKSRYQIQHLIHPQLLTPAI